VAKAATQVDVRGQRPERLLDDRVRDLGLAGGARIGRATRPNGGRPAGLEAVAQALRLWQRCERLERVVFDLPDPRAGDAEGAPHLAERSRLTAM
jgi:hypothetical protein